ncbi:MAG: hypothetical protein GY719_18760 [bacterium]|nr:hypothetical protein [bacterium]
MVESSFELKNLEIIGYADSLSRSLVPQVVPPVFRLVDEPERILMPPFRIMGDRVTAAASGCEADFERAVKRGQATRFEVAVPARPAFRLWIDEALEPHYEDADKVSRALLQLAHKRARKAQEALAGGRLAEASRHAQAAIAADDGCLNAILVKALVHQLEGDHDSVEILTEIAELIVPGADLKSWILFFSALVSAQEGRRIYSTYSPVSLVGEPASKYQAQATEDDQPSDDTDATIGSKAERSKK